MNINVRRNKQIEDLNNSYFYLLQWSNFRIWIDFFYSVYVFQQFFSKLDLFRSLSLSVSQITACLFKPPFSLQLTAFHPFKWEIWNKQKNTTRNLLLSSKPGYTPTSLIYILCRHTFPELLQIYVFLLKHIFLLFH